jgi:Ni,Fe-hydrogenase I large subunit
VAPFYLEWAGYGEGIGNFMACGDFPDRLGTQFLPAGIILNRDLSTVHPLDQGKVTEYVTHSWFKYSEGDEMAKHPWEGETIPQYTGPQPPYQLLNTEGKYSWMKAPRYEDKPMEVGPLARMLVAYASGHPRVKEVVDTVLNKLGAGPEALFSTLGRTAARGVETLVIAEQLVPWLDELATNMAEGNLQIHNGEKWDPKTWPTEAQGVGFTEAPRGMLGHWIRIKGGMIENYQCVVPSTWNASPRDAKGQRGPYEAALIGTPVADPGQPIEILRTIHSFDPCMACAVHMVDGSRREIVQVRLDGSM